MRTITITINEDIITAEDIFNDAWRERLDNWAREQSLIEKAEAENKVNELAKVRRQKFEKQMEEISRIINQINEQ